MGERDLQSSVAGTLGAASVGGRPRGAHANRAFGWMVRGGFVARSITYGVIGALALAMAVGAGTAGNTPDQQGALALIAKAPAGRVALVVICVGLLGYALWKLVQGFTGRGPEGGGGLELKDRVANLAGGVAYLLFFFVAIRSLIGGSGGGSGREARQAAAGMLGWPGGQLIVGIAGVVLLAISLYQLWDAAHGGFAADTKREQMNADERRLFLTVGRVGLSARALVFALVGYFLLRTAIEYKPSQAVGVNGALERLQHQAFGPWLLGLVALGLLVFALYSLLEARFRRL